MSSQDLLLRIERLEAAQACRNLMGKYSYYHTAFRNKEYIDLWAKRDDCMLIMPFGVYHGFEGVKACYMQDHGDRDDPNTYERIRGSLMMHEMDTEVLEVAADGKTARGAWISPGHETYISKEEGKIISKFEYGTPVCEWCWGKYAVDFIKEPDGQWKIWHMRLYPLFKAEYRTPWTEYAQPTPEEDWAFTQGEALPEPAWQWSPTAVYPANEPEPPLPYSTYDKPLM